jgi:hypothetical protein
LSVNPWPRTILPSRTVHTCHIRQLVSTPLRLPRPPRSARRRRGRPRQPSHGHQRGHLRTRRGASLRTACSPRGRDAPRCPRGVLRSGCIRSPRRRQQRRRQRPPGCMHQMPAARSPRSPATSPTPTARRLRGHACGSGRYPHTRSFRHEGCRAERTRAPRSLRFQIRGRAAAPGRGPDRRRSR